MLKYIFGILVAMDRKYENPDSYNLEPSTNDAATAMAHEIVVKAGVVLPSDRNLFPHEQGPTFSVAVEVDSASSD
jgi:hypothetical protein